MTIAVTLFTVGLLFTHQSARKDYRYFLAAFLGFYTLIKIDELFILVGGYHYFPHFLGVLFPVKLFLAPAIYFYARSIISNKPQWFIKRDLAVLIAPLIAVMVAVPFYILPSHEKIALLSETTRDSEKYKLALLGCQIGLYLFFIVSLTYLYASIRLLLRNIRKASMLFSRIDDKSITWLRFVIVLLAIGWAAYCINEIWSISGGRPTLFKFSVTLFELFWIGLIAFYGLRQHPINVAVTDYELDSHQPQSSYKKSKLNLTQIQTIAQKLDQSMTENSLYIDPDLSLRQLSDQIGISENHISETFSRHFNKNFFDYVNGYRIAQACQQLNESNETILNIAMDVGFNSRSTFNTAFRKHTGTTPSQYRKKINKPAAGFS